MVDDDEAIRLTVKELLAEEGYSVRGASNGSEALAILRETSPLPAVILLDLMMPVMDGWTFRRAQADDPRLAAIPVVVLTAAASIARELRELAVDALLAKPLRLETLLATVARYCSRDGSPFAEAISGVLR